MIATFSYLFFQVARGDLVDAIRSLGGQTGTAMGQPRAIPVLRPALDLTCVGLDVDDDDLVALLQFHLGAALQHRVAAHAVDVESVVVTVVPVPAGPDRRARDQQPQRLIDHIGVHMEDRVGDRLGLVQRLAAWPSTIS